MAGILFTMYQTLVLGLGILLLIGVGYFIEHTDQAGIITSAVSTEVSTSTTQNTPTNIAGTYVCDVDSKCNDPKVLVLKDDGELHMTTSYASGVEILEEVGTWLLEAKGDVAIFLTGTNTEVYVAPHMFYLRKVSDMTLVGLPSTNPEYKEWGSSLFRKKTKEEE